MFKNEDIKKAILFTLMMLLVYRIGSALPIPDVNATIPLNNNILNTLNLLGGGALERMSIFSLGVGPYITAGIIIQLLSMDVIPVLSDWRKEGDTGRKKSEKVTKYLTVVLAFIQALSITYGFDRQYQILNNPTISRYLFTALMMTAGSMLLLFIASQISKKGIGNGTSMIILAGIVSKIPSTLLQTWNILVGSGDKASLFNGVLTFVGYIMVYLLIMGLVIAVETAVRKIPIQPTNRANTTGGNTNYLPFKLNNASVVPVIFAQAVLTAPQIVLSFVKYEWYEKLSNVLSLNKPLGLTIYAILIIAFAFFYTHQQTNAEEIEKNLRNSNMFIPGIRLGKETVVYVKKVLNRLTLIGSILLMLLAVTPYVLTKLTNLSTASALGGTGIILIVGITLETINQISTQNKEMDYQRFVRSTTHPLK